MLTHSHRRVGGATRTLARCTIALAFIATLPVRADAQSTGERITSAVRRATAFAADISLASVKPIDVEARGLSTMAFGGLTVGVSAVQVHDTTALRIRAFLLNSGTVPITIPVPPEDSFVVVDARGRRLTTLAAPKYTKLPKGADVLTIPPLERVDVVLLFTNIPADAVEVFLKVGAAGVIRGIPLRTDVAPTFAATASPTPPTSPTNQPPGTMTGQPPWATTAAPTSPVTSMSPPTPPGFPAPATATGAALAGDWHESTTLASIHLNADGSYTTASGVGGAFTAQGVWVVFTGALSIWNGGRAVLSDGAIEFRWTDAAGSEKRFTFVRR